ncbi:MAG: hypothetical protein GY804_13445 [Alphaproteobacteria bacterium]|nr:hypothetical protein [Alphaproteobacteria bacterium]
MKSNNRKFIKIAVLLLVLCVTIFASTQEAVADNKYEPESQTISTIADVLEGCLLCGLYRPMLQAMASYSEAAKNALISPCLTLLGLGLGFWILIHTLKNIAYMGFMDSGVENYLKSLFVRILLTVVIAGLLNSWGGTSGMVELFNALVASLFYTSAVISNEFMAVSLATSHSEVASAGASNDMLAFCSVAQCVSFPTLELQDKMISDEMIELVICMMQRMGMYLKTGLVLSYVLFNLAVVEGPFGIFLLPFALLLGIVIAFPYFSMLFYIPMYLLDAVTKIMVVGVLLPLAAVAYVFPSTRWFSQGIFETVIHACLIFLFMGLFIGISMEFLVRIFEKLADVLALDDAEEVLERFHHFKGSDLAVIVVLPYMLMTMLGKAEPFAIYFGGARIRGTGFMSAAAAITIDRGKEIINSKIQRSHEFAHNYGKYKNARDEARSIDNRIPPRDGGAPAPPTKYAAPVSYEPVSKAEKPREPAEYDDPLSSQKDVDTYDGRHGDKDERRDGV